MAKKKIPAKMCSRCRGYKSLEHFSRNRAQVDGRQNECTACRRIVLAEAQAKRQRPHVASKVRTVKAGPQRLLYPCEVVAYVAQKGVFFGYDPMKQQWYAADDSGRTRAYNDSPMGAVNAFRGCQ